MWPWILYFSPGIFLKDYVLTRILWYFESILFHIASGPACSYYEFIKQGNLLLIFPTINGLHQNKRFLFNWFVYSVIIFMFKVWFLNDAWGYMYVIPHRIFRDFIHFTPKKVLIRSLSLKDQDHSKDPLDPWKILIGSFKDPNGDPFKITLRFLLRSVKDPHRIFQGS